MLIESFQENLKKLGVLVVPHGLDYSQGKPLATLPEDTEDAVEDSIEEIEKKFQISDTLRQKLIRIGGEQAYKDHLLSEARKERRLKGVGGVGVTGRTYQEVITQYPELKEKLIRVRGNIIILGNGLSSLPLELLEKNSEITRITVVDIFDINVVTDQLRTIATAVDQDVRKRYLELADLLENISKNPSITVLSKFVGKDSLEELYGKFDFVINIAGPSEADEIMRRLLKDASSEIINH